MGAGPMMEAMTQTAPFPTALQEVVDAAMYRPGWRLFLRHEVRDQGEVKGEGLTFCVSSLGYDTYHPELGEKYRVLHTFIVPAATYDKRAWTRWVLDCLLLIEQHECCEFFTLEVDEDTVRRPFAPNHGPGRNPYSIVELSTVADAETRFAGERIEGSQA
jgi:hypothetical protein